MCFYLNSSKDKSKVAKENIVCYKLSDTPHGGKSEQNKFEPAYMYFTYTLNKRTPLVKLRKWDSDTVYEGYHSFISARSVWGNTLRAGKFIIPKGAKYYENEKEYVSETLIFKGWLTEREINKIIKQETK